MLFQPGFYWWQATTGSDSESESRITAWINLSVKLMVAIMAKPMVVGKEWQWEVSNFKLLVPGSSRESGFRLSGSSNLSQLKNTVQFYCLIHRVSSIQQFLSLGRHVQRPIMTTRPERCILREQFQYVKLFPCSLLEHKSTRPITNLLQIEMFQNLIMLPLKLNIRHLILLATFSKSSSISKRLLASLHRQPLGELRRIVWHQPFSATRRI